MAQGFSPALESLITADTPHQRLERHAREWGVSIDETRSTETSLVAFGTRGGQDVVLKVIQRTGSEEWRSGEILSRFDGHGVIRPVAHCDGAVLLPRLSPGHDLSSLSLAGHDDEATEVLASLIREMPRVTANLQGIPSVERLGEDFARFRDSGGPLLTRAMVDQAEILFSDLCSSSGSRRLLHGDLHHSNVLFDQVLGWVAIDPWGVTGELEFELGAALRNPIDAPDLLDDPKTMERRLLTYTRRLKLDADRALRWGFAMTVLAVLWPVAEDGIDMRKPFAIAARSMLQVLGDVAS